ncbi:hypothetical protein [Streptomyces mangrovi]|uniref:hypothetical protein n=1 Tax=Streptomyces mangrovi TaxID=1206892 RepID=UPI00399CC4F8
MPGTGPGTGAAEPSPAKPSPTRPPAATPDEPPHGLPDDGRVVLPTELVDRASAPGPALTP